MSRLCHLKGPHFGFQAEEHLQSEPTLIFRYIRNPFISVLSTSDDIANRTVTEAQLALCGVNYCSASPSGGEKSNEDGSRPLIANETSLAVEENDNFKTDPVKIYILAGIFLLFAILSPIIISIGVDPLSK